MKPFALLPALLIFFTACFSQKAGTYYKDSADIAKVKYLRIYYDGGMISRADHPISFGSIEVFDARYDTTNIGIWSGLRTYPYVGYVIENRKMNFGDGLANAMKKYLSGYYKQQPGADTGLVCFIKQFYLSRRDTADKNQGPHENFGELSTEIECYFKIANKLYPASKTDTSFINTVIIGKNQFSESVNDVLISDFITAVSAKLDKINKAKVLQRTPSEINALKLKYIQRLNLPVLQNQGFTKGVFLSFDEFKNNAPSIKEFKIKKEKYKSISLSDKEGNNINAMKIFGFSDGGRLWIQFGNYCFPLIKTGNSFEFFYTISPSIRLLVAINMENGKFY